MMAWQQPTKAHNDNGDQCDSCQRCVTLCVRELYTLKKGPAWGHMQRCFELDSVAVFGASSRYCLPVKEAKGSIEDAVKQRERRSVGRWSKMCQVTCARTSRARTLHGAVFCAGCANGQCHGLRRWRQVLFTHEKSKRIHRGCHEAEKRRSIWQYP